MSPAALSDVWRHEQPHVLAALLRRHGDLSECEDATQEAAAAAAVQWPRDGVPANPRGWLIRVASRRLIDQQRAQQSRRAREEQLARWRSTGPGQAEQHDPEPADGEQDTLQLALLCCHPALSRTSQVALTLRAVSGLTTAQVAAAFLVPEATMAQRLTRARATLRSTGARFAAPAPDELPERLAATLDVCHLVFTEGCSRSAGAALVDLSLAEEAIGLVRRLVRALPDHDEAAGLLALMLLTHARTPARTDQHGDLIALAAQDRSRWRAEPIAEGVRLLEVVLPRGHVGRFQLQAAIAAVHAEAATFEQTDWPQIVLLYAMLSDLAPSPVVTLNRAVAVGMARGPAAGLALVEPLLADPAMARHHRTHAVRGHLQELTGDLVGAVLSYREASRLTASLPEQRYLNARAARVRDG